MELTIKNILEYHLFSLGKYTLTVYQIVSSAIIILIGFSIIRVLRSLIYKSDKIDIGKKFAFTQILKYISIVFTSLLVFNTLGVDISPLLLGGSVIFVGIGLGLQNLFLDFISGVIILLDRSIKVDDIVEIENVVGKVQQVNIRTSTIVTRDNKNMIIPNSILTKNKIVNMSYDDDIANFGVSIGVAYGSDIDLVMKLMIDSAMEHAEVCKERPPVVRLSNFGDFSLNFNLFFNSRYLFKAEAIKSDIRLTILSKFKENNIDIPYPTRTLFIRDNSKQA